MAHDSLQRRTALQNRLVHVCFLNSSQGSVTGSCDFVGKKDHFMENLFIVVITNLLVLSILKLGKSVANSSPDEG